MLDATRSRSRTIEYDIELWAERRGIKLANDIMQQMRQGGRPWTVIREDAHANAQGYGCDA